MLSFTNYLLPSSLFCPAKLAADLEHYINLENGHVRIEGASEPVDSISCYMLHVYCKLQIFIDTMPSVGPVSPLLPSQAVGKAVGGVGGVSDNPGPQQAGGRGGYFLPVH